MIPAGFPAVAPTATLADLFGPLAPVAGLAALAALGVLIALMAGESWMSLRRRRHARVADPAGSGSGSTPLRPAA
jgi:hypothetical protein